MRLRYLFALIWLLVSLTAGAGATLAQAAPEYRLGFKAIADHIPDVVGNPVENEHSGPNGDSLQQTTTGLMVWRKADNWTAFTNGDRTWINGPYGLQERSNAERFAWEKELAVAASAGTASRLLVPGSTSSPTTGLVQQSYAPIVKAMDEESATSKTMVEEFLRELDGKWARIWGWQPRRPVTVYLYFDGYRMADGVISISGLPMDPGRREEIAATTAGLKARDGQTGGWAIFMNLKRYYATDRWAIRVRHLLTHELTHVMQSDVAGAAGPTWFHEGMAEVAAFVEVPEALPFLGRTKYVTHQRDLGELPSLRELQDKWQELMKYRDERSQMAYGMSYLAVKYLADRVGGMPLLQVLASTAKGKSFEVALLEITGYSVDQLDAEYRQTIPPSTTTQP